MVIKTETNAYNVPKPRYSRILGSGALPGKMLLVRVIKSNKIDA